MDSFQIGDARVSGWIGHGLYHGFRLLTNRRVWRSLVWCFVTGVFAACAIVGITRYLGHRRAEALKSPIEKKTYVVEDMHGGGEYLVVRNDTKHFKLRCLGGTYKDDKNEMRTFAGQCPIHKIGDQLFFELWDGDYSTHEFVQKAKDFEGEYQYLILRGDE